MMTFIHDARKLLRIPLKAYGFSLQLPGPGAPRIAVRRNDLTNEDRRDLDFILGATLGQIDGGVIPPAAWTSGFNNSGPVRLVVDTSHGIRPLEWQSLSSMSGLFVDLVDFADRQLFAQGCHPLLSVEGKESEDGWCELEREVRGTIDRAAPSQLRFTQWHAMQVDLSDLLAVGPAGGGKSALLVATAIRALAARPGSRCHVVGMGNRDGLVFGRFLEATSRGSWNDADAWGGASAPRRERAVKTLRETVATAVPGDMLLVNDVDACGPEAAFAAVEEAMAKGLTVFATVQRVEAAEFFRPLFAATAFLRNSVLTREEAKRAGLEDEQAAFIRGQHAWSDHRPWAVLYLAKDGTSQALDSGLQAEAPVHSLFSVGNEAVWVAERLDAVGDPREWLKAFRQSLGSLGEGPRTPREEGQGGSMTTEKTVAVTVTRDHVRALKLVEAGRVDSLYDEVMIPALRVEVRIGLEEVRKFGLLALDGEKAVPARPLRLSTAGERVLAEARASRSDEKDEITVNVPAGEISSPSIFG